MTLAFQHDLDVHVLWDLDSHELPERALVGIKIYEALVHPHLPVVPGGGSLTVRALPTGNDHLLCRQGYGSCHVHACSLGNPLDLIAYIVQHQGVSAREPNSCFLHDSTPKKLISGGSQ